MLSITIGSKDLICVYADEAHIKLGYDTVKATLKEKKLRWCFDVVCKYSNDASSFIDIDALVRKWLRPTWNETFNTLVAKKAIALDMIKKIMSMTEVTNVCLCLSGSLCICIDGADDEVDNFIYSVPELYYVDTGLMYNFNIFSRDTSFAFRDTLDITKEIKMEV